MKSVLLLVSFLSIGFSNKTTIFCYIHTASPSHATLAATVSATWAKQCDDYLFFTDSPMSPEHPHVVFYGLDTRDYSWEKIRRVIPILATSQKRFDWYVRADDDAYLIVQNLRSFLSQFNPSEDNYLGYKWNYGADHGYADGSVYILSYSVLQKLNSVLSDPVRCPEKHVADEDLELGRCLKWLGIYPKDTRDENGSNRFHHYHPARQLGISKDVFDRWNSYYKIHEGKEVFSPNSISFHHLSPFEMRMMDFLLDGRQEATESE